MKIEATVSEFHRDVVHILKSRDNNGGQNKEVNDLGPLLHRWVNSDHRPGSEHVIGSRLPGDPSPCIWHIRGISASTTQDLLRTSRPD